MTPTAVPPLPCRATPDAFFITSRGPAAQAQAEVAIRLCRGCPARVPCLADVLTWPVGRRQVGMVAGGRYWRVGNTEASLRARARASEQAVA
jgi:hypothetical protein